MHVTSCYTDVTQRAQTLLRMPCADLARLASQTPVQGKHINPGLEESASAVVRSPWSATTHALRGIDES